MPGHPAAANAPDSSTQPTALRSHANPLASCQRLRARSHYLAPSSGDLRYPGWPDRPVTPRDRTICQQLQSHVGAAGYPCVMARSVFNRETFRLAVYGGLGSAVAEVLMDHATMPKFFHRIALRSGFSSVVGSQAYLRTHYGLDAAAIKAVAKDYLNRK